jgi:hypothetical protein
VVERPIETADDDPLPEILAPGIVAADLPALFPLLIVRLRVVAVANGL